MKNFRTPRRRTQLHRGFRQVHRYSACVRSIVHTFEHTLRCDMRRMSLPSRRPNWTLATSCGFHRSTTGGFRNDSFGAAAPSAAAAGTAYCKLTPHTVMSHKAKRPSEKGMGGHRDGSVTGYHVSRRSQPPTRRCTLWGTSCDVASPPWRRRRPENSSSSVKLIVTQRRPHLRQPRRPHWNPRRDGLGTQSWCVELCCCVFDRYGVPAAAAALSLRLRFSCPPSLIPRRRQ